MLQIRPAKTLDSADYGWLKARYHFKVTPEGNPANTPVGSLVVWNDDEIAPGTGFPMHSHRNLEIISYVREGAVSHADDAGGRGRTAAGDVQVMSAGRGIRHEEYNRDGTPLKLFQIWLESNQRDAQPGWQSRPFPREHRAGQLVTLASGLPGDDDAVPIRANARVMGATLKLGQEVRHRLLPGSQAYLVPSTGALLVNGEAVGAGDGVAVTDEAEIVITAATDAEVVLVEVQ